MTETEEFVIKAVPTLLMGDYMENPTQSYKDAYRSLYNAWRSYNYDPSQLKLIKHWDLYGIGIKMFLRYYERELDIDVRQQLASISYLFLSKVVKRDSSFEAIGNRIELMMSNKQVFEYILSSVLPNRSYNALFSMFGPLKDGDAVLKMEFADLSRNAKLLEINEFSTIYRYLCESWRGKEKAMIAEGNQYHDDLLTYLEKKVIDKGDVDF